jgi:hypothetical protein
MPTEKDDPAIFLPSCGLRLVRAGDRFSLWDGETRVAVLDSRYVVRDTFANPAEAEEAVGDYLASGRRPFSVSDEEYENNASVTPIRKPRREGPPPDEPEWHPIAKALAIEIVKNPGLSHIEVARRIIRRWKSRTGADCPVKETSVRTFVATLRKHGELGR